MSDFVTDMAVKAAFLRLEDELAKANEIIKRLDADLATSEKHRESAETKLAKAREALEQIASYVPRYSLIGKIAHDALKTMEK